MHGNSARGDAGAAKPRLPAVNPLAALALALGVFGGGAGALGASPALRGLQAYGDGHARPRALAVDAGGDLLYVALSTADRLAVVDVTGAEPRRLADLPICAFPDALAARPGGGVVVSCRFDPALRVVGRASSGGAAEARPGPRFEVRAVDAGPEHGDRAVALDSGGRFAYVGSAARGGVKIVDLAGPPAPPRFVATGAFPQALRFVPADPAAGRSRPWLLVANLASHTVGVHPIEEDGGLAPAVQTIQTAAPVRDLAIVGAGGGATLPGLVLATYEDRTLSRERLSVEGLDSVLLQVPFAASPGAAAPFADPGPGRRTSVNLSERPGDPVVALESLAVDPRSGRIAIAGAGTDNVLVTSPAAPTLGTTPSIAVGTNPSAIAFLPDGRVVTADRLSDTLTFVSLPAAAGGAAAPSRVQTLALGRPERLTPAEQGEVLFYGRALVPRNVATGPLSIYTCASCHADGHVDGRRHPSKRNRFYTMTKTCRGLAGTEPFLTIGDPDTFAAFADNIVATHAQGALDAPDTFDQYPVQLRLRAGGAWTTVTLSPAELRGALASYMARIPVEPSPFGRPGRRALSAPERRGLTIFRADCARCHQLRAATGAGPAVPAAALEGRLLAGELVLTSARRYDVGTPVIGEGGNNPPSLRGVWAAAPYFSDGSAATLEDAIRRTNPAAERVHAPDNATHPAALSVAQQADLAAFLRAL